MKRFGLLFSLFVFVLIITSCENDYPPSLWDPSSTMKETPIITQIIPVDSSYAGVGEMTIKGNHFSANANEIVVYFNSDVAQILSASETEIVVKTPVVIGDSIKIRIAVQGAMNFSETIIYKLKAAVSIMGNLAENELTGAAIAMDENDNIYVSIEGKLIKKIDPTGKVSHHADVTFLKAAGMKMGPANTLYAAFAAGRVRKIATIDPNGIEGTFVNLPGNPEDLDFDQNGNIWTNAGKDIYLVKPDKSLLKIKTISMDIRTIRVYNDHLYLMVYDLAMGGSKIWRYAIQGESLGTEEEVLNLTEQTWLQGATVNALTFSEDGDIFLVTDNTPDAIFVYKMTDGSHEVLYPGLIGPNIVDLTWSDKRFLSAIQVLESGSNVLKIVTQKNGAPYYGRQ